MAVDVDRDSRIDALNDEELCRALAGELAHVTGATISVSDTLVRRWNEAFPQYAPGHGPRMRAVERLLGQRPGLALAGATLGGIGLPACITSGERAAEVVSASVTAAA
jgi:oxygen-dependent protoporphyrinogen oxidase